MEGGGAQTSRAVGQTIRLKAAILWVAMAVLMIAAAIVGGLAVFRANKVSQARHDVQVIVLTLDGFARENGDYPHGTRGEICRMLRGETVNGQNPRKLDYVEAQPHELNGLGEFIDPWGEPYRMSVDHGARVYSCGPNRIDEHGQGDDIANWK
jgi:type II secretory pathway pseudopilin PulG